MYSEFGMWAWAKRTWEPTCSMTGLSAEEDCKILTRSSGLMRCESGISAAWKANEVEIRKNRQAPNVQRIWRRCRAGFGIGESLRIICADVGPRKGPVVPAQWVVLTDRATPRVCHV